MDPIAATLTRQPSAVTGTQGTLAVLGAEFATLELGWYDNITDFSCIQPGPGQPAITYEGVWDPAAGPAGRYRIQNVEGRTGDEIHNGNWGGDTRQIDPDTQQPYKCNIEGCIILGLNHAIIEGQFGVEHSVAAVASFLGLTGKQPLLLTIQNA